MAAATGAKMRSFHSHTESAERQRQLLNEQLLETESKMSEATEAMQKHVMSLDKLDVTMLEDEERASTMSHVVEKDTNREFYARSRQLETRFLGLIQQVVQGNLSILRSVNNLTGMIADLSSSNQLFENSGDQSEAVHGAKQSLCVQPSSQQKSGLTANQQQADPTAMPFQSLLRKLITELQLIAKTAQPEVAGKSFMSEVVDTKDSKSTPLLTSTCTHSELAGKSFTNSEEARAEDSFTKEGLIEALMAGDQHMVQSILQKRADPNAMLDCVSVSDCTIMDRDACGQSLECEESCHALSHLGSPCASSMPLAIAAMRGNPQVAMTLLEHRAVPDARFTITAGKEHVNLMSSAMHAASFNGSLDLLNLLLQNQANVNVKTNLNGTPVWVAASSGHAAAVKYLLDAEADVDVPAQSADDLSTRYTPLHAAVLSGHPKVVSILLEKRASASGQNKGNTPLLDAIVHGHSTIARELIISNADLYTKCSIKSQDSLSSTGRNLNAMEMLFNCGNSTVIAHVADALRSVSVDYLRQLARHDVTRFLTTPGEAPILILQAIFRKHEIIYWTMEGNRVHATSGLTRLRNKCEFNVELGPHHSVLQRLYMSKSPLSSEATTFLEHLAPQRGKDVEHRVVYPWSSGDQFRFSDGTTQMCHVLGIDHGQDVLKALYKCPLHVFEIESAQVIVEHHWKSFRVFYLCDVSVYVLTLCVYCSISVLMHSDEELVLTFGIWFGLFLWMVEISRYWAIRLGRWTLERKIALVEYGWYPSVRIRIGAQGVLLVFLAIHGLKCRDSVVFNAVHGFTLFNHWGHVLYFSRGMQKVGMNLLPIQRAMKQIGPFCVVMSVYMFGLISLFYCLHVYSLWEAIANVYRISIFGDVAFNTLDDGRPKRRLSNAQEHAVRNDDEWPMKKETEYIVDVASCGVGLLVTVCLMNVFIAVLSEGYVRHSKNALTALLRSRIEIMLNSHMTLVGWSRVLPAPLKRYIVDEDSPNSYLWYFSPDKDWQSL